MSTSRVRTDLRFTVTFDHAPGDAWPRLKVASDYQAEVRQVTVDVLYEDGELEAQTPSITIGRRVRKDGTLGRTVGSCHGYYSFWERDGKRDEIDAQSEQFRTQALAIARQEFARLLGASLTVEGAGSYER